MLAVAISRWWVFIYIFQMSNGEHGLILSFKKKEIKADVVQIGCYFCFFTVFLKEMMHPFLRLGYFAVTPSRVSTSMCLIS